MSDPHGLHSCPDCSVMHSRRTTKRRISYCLPCQRARARKSARTNHDDVGPARPGYCHAIFISGDPCLYLSHTDRDGRPVCGVHQFESVGWQTSS